MQFFINLQKHFPEIIFSTSFIWGNVNLDFSTFLLEFLESNIKKWHHHLQKLTSKVWVWEGRFSKVESWIFCEDSCCFGVLVKVTGNTKNKEMHLNVIRGGSIEKANIEKCQRHCQAWRREVQNIISWGTRVLENDEENGNPFVPIDECRKVLQVTYKGETYI